MSDEAKEICDAIMREYGDEVWIGSGYGAGEDLRAGIAKAIAAKDAEIEALQADLIPRPICDLHEDHGTVIAWAVYENGDLVDTPQCVHRCDTDFDESDYTHFIPFPKLNFATRTPKSPRASSDAVKAMDLNGYAKLCHAANAKWWHDKEGRRIERNKGELLCLIHSEVSEAMEGERKNLMDDKLPHRKMAEVELADAVIRIFDYVAGHGYDLQGAFDEKMAYNAHRADHTMAEREKANGKKW